MERVEKPRCHIETWVGGTQYPPKPCFEMREGWRSSKHPQSHQNARWGIPSRTSMWWRGRSGWESPLSHRNTRWRGGAGHRSPPSRVSTQWGVGSGQKSPLSRQNMRWGIVMRRCPLSHTSTQWRGRDGWESPPSHRNMRWWVVMHRCPRLTLRRDGGTGMVKSWSGQSKWRETSPLVALKRQNWQEGDVPLVASKWLATEGTVSAKYYIQKTYQLGRHRTHPHPCCRCSPLWLVVSLLMRGGCGSSCGDGWCIDVLLANMTKIQYLLVKFECKLIKYLPYLCEAERLVETSLYSVFNFPKSWWIVDWTVVFGLDWSFHFRSLIGPGPVRLWSFSGPRDQTFKH